MLAKLVTHVILPRRNVYQQLVVMTCESSYPVTFGLHSICTACHGGLRVREGYFWVDFGLTSWSQSCRARVRLRVPI